MLTGFLLTKEPNSESKVGFYQFKCVGGLWAHVRMHQLQCRNESFTTSSPFVNKRYDIQSFSLKLF